MVVVRNKDRGLDARLPDPLGRTTLRGWQAKRFAASSIHWGQCRDSLDDAVAFWRPLRVTFVFSSDLSAADQDRFVTNLVERHPEVRVDFWSDADIQRLLRDTEEGRRAAGWLFGGEETLEDLLAAMVSKEPVRTPAEIAERQARLQELLDKDPHFYYTSVTRPQGAPHTPPAGPTVASFVLQFGGQEVRYDLAERYPGAAEDLGGLPKVVVSEDEAGREAARTLQSAGTANGPVKIESGLGVRWPVVPVGLRGLVPDETAWGAVEIREDEAPDAEPALGTPVAFLVRAGDDVLGMAFAIAEEAAPSFDATLVAEAGGLELMYSFVVDAGDDVAAHKLDWRHTLGVGRALDQLLSCRLMLQVLRGAPIQFHTKARDEPVLVATADAHPYGDDDLAALEDHVRFLKLVCEVQAWPARPLSPPARPTDDDLAELGRVLALVRRPQRHGTWSELTVTVGDDAKLPDRCMAAVLEAVYTTLFDSRVYLGIDLFTVRARLDAVMGDQVRFVPDDDEAVVVTTLQRPDAAPAEAARPRGDQGGALVLVRPLQE